MRSGIILATLLALACTPAPSLAKSSSSAAKTSTHAASNATQCKDAKGKFTKCPSKATEKGAMAATSAAKPTAASVFGGGAPAGATAKCKDGSYSMSKGHSGACSHHGGVANWLK
jgi:hypothetical protein